MNTDISIRVHKLGKRYIRFPSTKGTAYRTLREDLVDLPKRLMTAGGGAQRETHWALRNVSFEVRRGEVLGVIGRNGAGKSTLLKILSRIIDPTEGFAEINGRVGSLLEVGTGFHPELTGRENIFLSGAILGLQRTEVRAQLDQIVQFAGVEAALDTPVKHYSSGMYARLGFAVAAHLRAEVLLMDEVLAVGDQEFQRRCIGKLSDVVREGRTVLFVSHDLVAVRRLCHFGLCLDAGQVLTAGKLEDVLKRYTTSSAPQLLSLERPARAKHPCTLRRASLRGELSTVTKAFLPGTSIYFEAIVETTESLGRLQFALRISSADGVPLFTTTNEDPAGQPKHLPAGRHLFGVQLPGWFAPGRYCITAALCDPRRTLYDTSEDELCFEVDAAGSLSDRLSDDRRGLVECTLAWNQGLAP